MSFVVVGASAGVGRALAESLAARGHDLVLVASDIRDLSAEAAHIQLTTSVRVATVAADLETPESVVDDINAALATLGQLEGMLFPIGYSTPEDTGLLGGDELRRILNVNLLAVAALTSAFLPTLLARRRGSIVGFGSIAAARGRQRNTAYAAAKRGLRSYFESLACVTRGTGVEVQLYQLGYVDTQQSFGRRLFPPPSDPRDVAEAVAGRLGHGSRIVYFPRFWYFVAAGLRLLPQSLFCRLPF